MTENKLSAKKPKKSETKRVKVVTLKTPMFAEEEKMRIKDPEDRKKIRNLTVALVAGMVEKGNLDPRDNAALKKATMESAKLAHHAYYAALEFLCG